MLMNHAKNVMGIIKPKEIAIWDEYTEMQNSVMF